MNFSPDCARAAAEAAPTAAATRTLAQYTRARAPVTARRARRENEATLGTSLALAPSSRASSLLTPPHGASPTAASPPSPRASVAPLPLPEARQAPAAIMSRSTLRGVGGVRPPASPFPAVAPPTDAGAATLSGDSDAIPAGRDSQLAERACVRRAALAGRERRRTRRSTSPGLGGGSAGREAEVSGGCEQAVRR